MWMVDPCSFVAGRFTGLDLLVTQDFRTDVWHHASIVTAPLPKGRGFYRCYNLMAYNPTPKVHSTTMEI
jgi:hypothetical protein